MSDQSAELRRLLEAATPLDQDSAWVRFVEAYSPLVLHVARQLAHDSDETMDAYTYVLGELRANDFARLRTFAARGHSKVSTWLIVVARRLCIDHYRRRFGRRRSNLASESAHLEQLFRQRLRRLAGDDVERLDLSAPDAGPEDQLAAADLYEALGAAVESLSHSDRTMLALRFEQDLSAQQIARLMQLPSPFHVYRRIDSIIQALRAFLSARGVESATP